MEASLIQTTGLGALGVGTPTVLPERSGRQDDFARIMGKATSAVSNTPEAARQAAEEFVAMSLVQPLLAQLRSTNHTAAPFAPSSGEAQFQQMLDANIAQNIVRAKQFPLVESVARKLMRGKNVEGAGKENRES